MCGKYSRKQNQMLVLTGKKLIPPKILTPPVLLNAHSLTCIEISQLVATCKNPANLDFNSLSDSTKMPLKLHI